MSTTPCEDVNSKSQVHQGAISSTPKRREGSSLIYTESKKKKKGTRKIKWEKERELLKTCPADAVEAPVKSKKNWDDKDRNKDSRVKALLPGQLTQ